LPCLYQCCVDRNTGQDSHARASADVAVAQPPRIRIVVRIAGSIVVIVSSVSVGHGKTTPAAEVAALVATAEYVDGGVIGPLPTESSPSRLYLSGERAGELAGILGGGPLEAIAIDGGPTAASALKMTYAAWTKGTAAMLLAVRETAAANGVLDPLLAEWSRSQPALAGRLAGAQRSAATKGWRWTGEMREIAATFQNAGQPAGFHQAAAAIYESYDRPAG